MTLIVAVGCTDGVILVADSAATDEESGTKQPVEKIKLIPDQPILWGFSGDVGIMQKLDEELQSFTPKGTLKNSRQELKRRVLPILAESTRSHVPYPQRPFNTPPVMVLLIAGVHQSIPWILEIERDGRDTMYYTQDFGYFAAIGSGKPWAHAVMRVHLTKERSLEVGKLLAYRIVDDAIAIAASGLAEPVRMFVIDANGQVSEVPDPKEAFSATAEVWRELEREALGKALAPAGLEEVQLPEPSEEPEGPAETEDDRVDQS